MKDSKVEEFINRKQGSMLFREYFLKFVTLYRQERPRNKNCGITHGGECMKHFNACDGCDKTGHILKDFPNGRKCKS